jgi:hypothetical protein
MPFHFIGEIEQREQFIARDILVAEEIARRQLPNPPRLFFPSRRLRPGFARPWHDGHGAPSRPRKPFIPFQFDRRHGGDLQ